MSESGEFKGLFRDKDVKDLFDIMLKHFVFCIKKKAVKQKDAEILLTQAVTNFMAKEVEK